jgi:DNA (cytosine-5)-methyltransferase 1
MSAAAPKLWSVFDFVDLFAGVGGFHAALRDLGGRGVQAAEIDPNAARVYEQNWALKPVSDVRWLAEEPSERVPDHAVLTAGFPCQPFSKSGRQLGMGEERGTLFHEVVRILRVKQPPVVMLENVRNIAGPRQRETWRTVLAELRDAGFQVAEKPLVFSPHLLPPEAGGAPQVRERVYIMGVLVTDPKRRRAHVDPVVENRPQHGWDPSKWWLADHTLGPEPVGVARQRYKLSDQEEEWIDTWNALLKLLGPSVHLPGHPLWEWTWRVRRPALAGMPDWKQSFVRRNHDFYLSNRPAIDAWRRAYPRLKYFPASRRKLEWQAQDGERDLWRHLIHLRPSGIRVKQATYAPALVAMNQTSIHGPSRRRLTPQEAARLQGFESIDFGSQVDALSYKQMGNAVNVGAARFVFTRFVEDNADLIRAAGPRGSSVVESVLLARPTDVAERTA